MIAALYVHNDGVYSRIPNIDIWDKERDARLFRGLSKVIAHPPCARWGNYATKNGKLLGDDGGCFAHALWAARTFGGIIEHPLSSQAWKWFGIHIPRLQGRWTKCDSWGWACSLDQGHFGHRAKKPTLLYFVGEKAPEISFAGLNENNRWVPVTDMGKEEREATPQPFAELLVRIVRET